QAGSAAIPVIGGIPAYSHFAVTGLPPGLSAALSGNAITISGTPPAAGTFSNIAVSLQDSIGVTARGTYSLTVNLAVGPTPLPADRAGQPYTPTIPAAAAPAPPPLPPA